MFKTIATMETYKRTEENRIRRGANRGTYDKAEIFKILNSGFIAHVNFIMNDTPMCLPMAYGIIDDKLYLHGSQTNRMLKGLLKHPRTSLTVTHLDGLVLAKSGLHHSVNYRSATLFGSVKLIEDKAIKIEALKTMIDLMIDNRWDTLRPITDSEIDRTMVVEFTIDSASAKIRATGVVDEASDADYPTWAGVIPIKPVALNPIQETDNEVDTPEHIKSYMEKHGIQNFK